MKTSHFFLRIGAAILVVVPQIVSATLLVGFYDGRTPANADVAAPGFSGQIFGSQLLSGSWNSADGTYGPDSAPGVAGAIDASQTSFGFGGAGPRSATMAVTNNSGSTYVLQRLLFDFTCDRGYPTTYAVSYSISGGPSNVSLISTTPDTGSVSGVNSLTWTDVASRILGVALTAGQTITFRWDTTNGGGLDNIALTAIPETCGLLALGCVLGSGLFLRSRPRQMMPRVV